MKYREARSAVEMGMGNLARVEIQRAPMSRGYNVYFENIGITRTDRNGTRGLPGYLENDKGKVREFRTIDAACRVIEQLGFPEARVHLNPEGF